MDDSDAAAGLCAQCAHCRPLRSARGSTFYRCDHASLDPAFPRYPRLPVVHCAGFAGRCDQTVTPAAAR
jgi:hypothetical protein